MAGPPKPPTFVNPILLGSQQTVETVAQNNLPIDQGSKLSTNINYAGSSYTGVDIQVVVHMYTSPDKDTQLLKLQNEVHVAEATANGADSLLAGGVERLVNRSANTREAISDNGKSTSNLIGEITGLSITDPNDVVAIASLVNALGTIPLTVATNMQVMLATNALINLSRSSNALTEDLRNKLQNSEEIRKNSADTLILGNLQTLSVQTFREKNAVRSLGQSYVKSYVRGPRTVAGSMIFTVFNEQSLAKLLRAMALDKTIYGENALELSSVLVDQLPPIDITIVFANEYGSLSSMSLYGVEFITNGMTFSVEDLLTEEVVQFVAREIDPMVSRGNIALDRNNRGAHFNADGSRDTTATSLLIGNKDQYNKFLEKLKVRRSLVGR